MMYELAGYSSGSCGCGAAVACTCWQDLSVPASSCGDSFVALHIERGTIHTVDVSGLNVIRLIRELNAQTTRSILYIDANASMLQRDRIAVAFCGGYGGILAKMAQLYGQTVVKVAPIIYCIQGKVVSIQLGGISVRDAVKQTAFSYKA